MTNWIKRLFKWIIVECLIAFIIIVSVIFLPIFILCMIFSYIYYNSILWWISFLITFLLFPIMWGICKYSDDHDSKEFIKGIRQAFLIELIPCIGILLLVSISGHFEKEKILPSQAWIYCDSSFDNNILLENNKSSFRKSKLINSDFIKLDSILNLTPIESALLYKDNYKNNSLLSDLFYEKIIPLYKNMNYYQLRDVNKILRGTPVEKELDSISNSKKDIFLGNIKKEIDINRDLQISLLSDTLSTILQFELDSLIIKRIENIQNEYSGGFLDFQKFAFLIGSGSSYFEKKWYDQIKKDTFINSEIIQKYLDIYIKQLTKSRNNYYQEWIPSYCCDFKIDKTHLTYLYPLKSDQIELIKDYTSKERVILMRDLTTNILTGGTGMLINGGIILNDVIKDWNKKTPEELLCILLTQYALADLKVEITKQSSYLKDILLNEDQILFQKIKESI